MPRQKTPKPDEWISSEEASRILTERSGHAVSDAYVRLLAKHGKIEVRPFSKRIKLFKRADVESYVVKQIKRPGEKKHVA